MSSGMEPTAIIDLPPQRHPQPAPRERILAAARELLFCHGIRAVGVDAIAEAAGTNKMTLYRHFASKDELVAECLRQLSAEKEAAWDAIAAAHEGDPLGELQAFLGLLDRGVGQRAAALLELHQVLVKLEKR